MRSVQEELHICSHCYFFHQHPGGAHSFRHLFWVRKWCGQRAQGLNPGQRELVEWNAAATKLLHGNVIPWLVHAFLILDSLRILSTTYCLKPAETKPWYCQSEKHAADQSHMTKAFYNECLCMDLSKELISLLKLTGKPNYRDASGYLIKPAFTCALLKSWTFLWVPKWNTSSWSKLWPWKHHDSVFRYSGSSRAIHYFCILILAATLGISDVCLSGPNMSVSNSFWKWIMPPKLLTSHLWINLALFLLSIEGHSEYLAASVFSTSALSTCYLSRYLLGQGQKSYSQIWQAQKFELQSEI